VKTNRSFLECVIEGSKKRSKGRTWSGCTIGVALLEAGSNNPHLAEAFEAWPELETSVRGRNFDTLMRLAFKCIPEHANSIYATSVLPPVHNIGHVIMFLNDTTYLKRETIAEFATEFIEAAESIRVNTYAPPHVQELPPAEILSSDAVVAKYGVAKPSLAHAFVEWWTPPYFGKKIKALDPPKIGKVQW
jgi:hypothetical protein